jgi:flagellar biosynthesis/type III secretory pathway protein FliH
VVEKVVIILHKITKPRSPFTGDAAEAYCFPDIFRGTGPIDEIEIKETGSPFQRIFTDAAKGLPGESSNGNFRKTGSSCEAQVPIDYQKIMNEMVLESRQKEDEAYRKGIQDGHKDGHEEGRKAGIAEGLQEIETMLHSLQQAIQDIGKFRKELFLQAEKETVSLSLAIARKILAQEPAEDPKVIAAVVKKTFETVAINAPVRIRINPSELGYMRERRHLIPIEGDVSFVEDASISCGGCVVESLSGDVDARIESQIQMVAEAFSPGLEKIRLDLEELS